MIARYAATALSLLLLSTPPSEASSFPHVSPRIPNAGHLQISPRSIVSDACASYATLERLNDRVKPVVDDLTQTTDFFSHYRVNLFHKKCPFWNDENGMCGNIACAVATLDNEDDIPEVWRAEELSKLEGPRAKHPSRREQKEKPQKPLGGGLGEDVGESCVVEYDDECDERDYCVPEDESATSKGDYVSLVQNPERFTGYAGEGAKQVWDAIYGENCFQRSSFPQSSAPGAASSWQEKSPAALDFKHVLADVGRQQALEQRRQHGPGAPFVAQTGLELDEECIEKRVFYKVVSGMHASISSHLCWDFLNQTTGEWTPNLACYESRLHRFPDRISNLYFNYALVTRAIAKLGPYLQGPPYVFCTGDREQDLETRAKVLAVTEAAASVPEIFDESLMFKNGEGPSLKEDFRNRFRNVSRLMDCVGCDKCRLWGKLQTAGYGAALKVLFEFDNDSGEIPILGRTELVALFNTYARVSSSLRAIGQFQKMIEEAGRPSQPGTQSGEGEGESKSEDESLLEGSEGAESHPPEPEESPAEADEDDDYDYDDDDDDDLLEDEPPKKPRQPQTVKEAFDEEMGRVIHATKIVVRSWINMPSLLWEIFTFEIKRAYRQYVGLPVIPRTWTFRLPDEL
ncbi:related to ERO1 protein, required for protein disulfide bond formation in the ER [Cephalotrichum gorgonifer]|uniref:Related to ERO1 protein, required for protein disulfide bond formation in the ER n=1 Tax=Cephalotrichum gorgonifer TaxID=2041049 RepID=A0AAE8MXE8_9PEZI|nr:related to ERO1 protein, required for protein disulfide bond formation in the ER [Cephalotrichum gorgonifer]